MTSPVYVPSRDLTILALGFDGVPAAGAVDAPEEAVAAGAVVSLPPRVAHAVQTSAIAVVVRSKRSVMAIVLCGLVSKWADRIIKPLQALVQHPLLAQLPHRARQPIERHREHLAPCNLANHRNRLTVLP